MMHIPTNYDCLGVWSRVFDAIVQRYAHIIRGQFTGHTHWDHFELFYDSSSKTKKAINANYIAPSMTTYLNSLPSFRVFEADSETKQILNIYQYRLHLDKWNEFTDPDTYL